MFSRLASVGLVALWVGVVSLVEAQPSADTCTTLSLTTTIEVSSPVSPSYIIEQQEYWSTSCAALKPSCIIFPKNAAEVSTVLQVLSANNERFAVKSGGHSPNNYFASVDGGPLISTQRMDYLTLDPETGIVHMGPGNRLDEAAAKLHGSGWTFVGGRIGNTGVGGLILGGGLSYMSAQYGWSASTVLAFEVVLANGTIVTASSTSHPDLFVALKGGGNNFGVVTTYILQAQPQPDIIYGGNLVFLRSPTTDRNILRAVRDFTEHNTDDRAAVIVTAERVNANLVDSWILFLFYDGPDVPPGTFDNFTSAGPVVLNTARQRTYADLMAFSNWVIVPGSVVMIGTETIPLPAAGSPADAVLGGLDEDVGSIHAHWRNVSGSVVFEVPGLIASIAYQPFPRRIAQAARARGQDLIDCDDEADRMIIEMNYSFLLHSDYARMADTMEATYGGIRERVLAWQADGTLPDGVYLPVFMNYGFYRQDYFGRLRTESRALARDVAERVDPEGLFRERTGGWKP